MVVACVLVGAFFFFQFASHKVCVWPCGLVL